MSQEFSLLSKIINASIGSAVGLFCVFPLDLIKTRLQSQQLGPNGEKMYSSIADCFRKTLRAEGFFGMYRGCAVAITCITPEKSIKLAVNDYVRFLIALPDGSVPLDRQIVAGAAAGCVQVLLSTPMELIKIQLQNAGRVAEKQIEIAQATARSVVMQQVRERGVFGLYRGIAPTAARDILFAVMYFPVFSAVNSLGPRKQGHPNEAAPWVSFLAGLVAGSSSAVSVTPFDVIKTRLQTMKKAQGEKEFNGMADCFRKTLKFEGPKAFFKGGLCRMMVLAPLYGIVQTIYFFNVGERLLGIQQ